MKKNNVRVRAAALFAAAAISSGLLTPAMGQTTLPRVAFDLRVHGTGGKDATVSQVGDIVVLDIFAAVHGVDADPTNDRIQNVTANIRSAAGGLMGDVLGLVQPAPFNAVGSKTGLQTDIDGDGDFDIGGIIPKTQQPKPYYLSRAATQIAMSSFADELFIGQVSFTATSLAGASTTVSFVPIEYNSGAGSDYATAVAFDNLTNALKASDPRVWVGPAVTIHAATVIDPGTTTFLSGTINAHVTVSGTVKPAAGTTLVINQGLDLTAASVFDTHDASGYGAHQVNINDAISGNAGGIMRAGSMTIGASTAGVFNQSSGATTIGQQLVVGGGAAGTLNISGGSITSSSLLLNSAGAVDQTDGDATFSALTASGSGASYVLDQGQLVTAAGTFNSGSSLIINGGNLNGGDHFRLEGSSLVLNGGTATFGLMTGTTTPASATQNGGMLNGFIHVGWNGAAVLPTPSVFTINDGAQHANIFIGKISGRFVQNGGTVGDSISHVIIVGPASATAEYRLHGGTLASDMVSVGWMYMPSTTLPQSLPGDHGELVQDGGTASVGRFDVAVQGRYTISGGSLAVKKWLRNYGTIDFADSTASFTARSGSFADFSHGTLLGTSIATFTGEVNSLMNFAPDFDPTTQIGHFSSEGLVHINGTPLTIPPAAVVGGSGIIEGNVTNTGTLSPGNSPGVISIVGDYAQAATGRLEIELEGVAADAFDTVDISGLANLDGELALSLLGDFVPTSDQSFVVLTAAGISGTFDNALDTVAFPGGRFDIDYSSTSVTLRNFTPVPEPAALALLMAGPVLVLQRRRRNNQ